MLAFRRWPHKSPAPQRLITTKPPIENYLRTHFGYTLQLSKTQVKDPIGNFLFERKQGHCEYFASSMAVMLRSLGIPSRVVTGFHSDEFNDITESYVVRAKNAHAWVEAYFPGYGWQMFDPTPPGAISSTRHGWARLALYVDAMSLFWREWIVSYDTSHQFTLGQAAVSGSRICGQTRANGRARSMRRCCGGPAKNRIEWNIPLRDGLLLGSQSP